jgi:PKD repeat protein
MKRICCLFFILFSFFLFSSTIAQAQITGIKIAGDPCTDITLSLQAEGTSSSPYFFWEFNDPASGVNDTATFTGLSAPPFPTHTFSAPSIYNVCVSFQEPGQAVTKVCRKIPVLFCCRGVILSGDTCLENNIPFNLSTTESIISITWNFGDPSSGASNTSTLSAPTHKFSNPGMYTISATVNAICGSFTVNFSQKIVHCSTSESNCTGIILSSDTCFGKNVGFDIQSYKIVTGVNWNFGDAPQWYQ